MEKYEIKDGINTLVVELIEFEGAEFYTIPLEYFENEVTAESDGYYWNDELNKWAKQIVDSTTTIF